MSTLAISVRDISKKYVIGKAQKSLGQMASELIQHPGRHERRAENAPLIWALKDINFDIQTGEVVGIVGNNGAGKSTLLKVLSRITKPTTGKAVLNGRLGSLLEVGTGFHAELTGRENVYMNGAILGMSRAEINSKFDEIVDFAGVEKFIDTPVKRYSSGMYVRLAFAVAAHLEPEILVIDEVLSVGDLAFQNKCLGTLQAVGQSGRTVLFVSHNLPAVTRLCSRAILLENGRLVKDGPVDQIVGDYTQSALSVGQRRAWSNDNAPGQDGIKLLEVSITSMQGEPIATADVEKQMRVNIRYRVDRAGLKSRCSAIFYSQGVTAFATMEQSELTHEKAGMYTAYFIIPANLLAENVYFLSVSMFSSQGVKQRYVLVDDVIAFQVHDPMSGNSARGDYAEKFSGVLRPLIPWNREYHGNDHHHGVS